MLKLRVPYFGYIMRRKDSLEKTMLGRVKDSRKRGRPNTRWTDSLKEATGLNLEELSRGTDDRTFWRSFIHRLTINWWPLDGTLQQQQKAITLPYTAHLLKSQADINSETVSCF